MTDSFFDKVMIRMVGDEASAYKQDLLPKSVMASAIMIVGYLSLIVPMLIVMVAGLNGIIVAITFFTSLCSCVILVTAGNLIQYIYDIRNILFRQWELHS